LIIVAVFANVLYIQALNHIHCFLLNSPATLGNR
jgi:hypothetical protein